MKQTTESGVNVMLNMFKGGHLANTTIWRNQDLIPRQGDVISIDDPYFYGEVARVVWEYKANGLAWVQVYVHSIESQTTKDKE